MTGDEISFVLHKARKLQDTSIHDTATQEQEVETQVVEIDVDTPSEPLSKKRKQEPANYLVRLTHLHPAKAEILRYFSQPCIPEQGDPLDFWKEHSTIYPTISKLASRYLSIPASSGPVERLFSIGSKFFRPERCRLSDPIFEKLMNIKCNGHLV